MDKLIDVVKALGGAAPSILIGIFLASMILIFLKKRIVFPLKYFWVLSVCLILSGSLLAGTGIVKGYEFYRDKQRTKAQIVRLHHLTSSEKRFLRDHYIRDASRSTWIDRGYDTTIASALDKEGIISEYGLKGQDEKGYTLHINNDCFLYLMENKNFVGLK